MEVARRLGATVVQHPWDGFVAQKARALANVTTPWALVLDADERLADGAAEAIARFVAAPFAAGARLRRANRWLGHEIRYGRWGRDRPLRLVRCDAAKVAGDDPHDVLEVDGAVAVLDGLIVHDPYRSVGDHLARIGRYADRHATSLHARGVKARFLDVAVRPPWHLVKALLLQSGWRDGVPGLAVAIFGAVRVAGKWIALWRLNRA